MKFIRQIKIEIQNILRSRFLLIIGILLLAASIVMPVISVIARNSREQNPGIGGPIMYERAVSVSYGKPYYDSGEEPVIVDGVTIEADGAAELARRSRGTPRIVNRLLKRVRDYAQVRADGVVSQAAVVRSLALEGVDEMGLTTLDRRYIETVIRFYSGGPVGIEAIAATLQEETDTLVDVVEPYLLKIGFITRTSSGRRASEAACRHLSIACRKDPLFERKG